MSEDVMADEERLRQLVETYSETYWEMLVETAWQRKRVLDLVQQLEEARREVDTAERPYRKAMREQETEIAEVMARIAKTDERVKLGIKTYNGHGIMVRHRSVWSRTGGHITNIGESVEIRVDEERLNEKDARWIR